MSAPAWLSPDISLVLSPPLVNTDTERDDRELVALVNQFDVEFAERYQIREIEGKRATFCNVYVSDLTHALCAPIPHWLDGRWQLVGDNAEWLRKPENGWTPALPKAAQTLADTGHPSVVVYDPADKAHGHIALLVPSNGQNGVWITQAGARNYRRCPLMAGFGKFADSVQFFTHS